MLLIVRHKHRGVLQSNACYLQVQITDNLTRLLKLRLELPKAPGRSFVVRIDRKGCQKHIQSRQVVSCTLRLACPMY